MKHRGDLMSVLLFGFVATLCFFAENTVAGLGWLVAMIVQLRIYFGIDIYKNEP